MLSPHRQTLTRCSLWDQVAGLDSPITVPRVVSDEDDDCLGAVGLQNVKRLRIGTKAVSIASQPDPSFACVKYSPIFLISSEARMCVGGTHCQVRAVYSGDNGQEHHAGQGRPRTWHP
jgi:hypothetical protein